MRIVLAFDEGYAPHAAALMEGLIDQSSVSLSFAILHARLGEETIRTLRDHFTGRVEALDFHRVGPELIARVAMTRNEIGLPAETYLRIFAPLFVKEPWALYMDIDIVCEGDIAPILDQIIQPQYLYAVNGYDERYKLDPIRLQEAHDRIGKKLPHLDALFDQRAEMLGMSRPIRYFGAGVMMMNLERWREEDMTGKLLDYIASTPMLPAADQDALNHIVDGRFGSLDPQWNYSDLYPYGPAMNYSPRELSRPAVLNHYIGPYKQWSYFNYNARTRATYWKYRARTPWPASKPADRTLKNVLRRIWRRYTPRFVLNAVRATMRLLSPKKDH